jgi:hypothetical protein
MQMHNSNKQSALLMIAPSNLMPGTTSMNALSPSSISSPTSEDNDNVVL